MKFIIWVKLKVGTITLNLKKVFEFIKDKFMVIKEFIEWFFV